MLGESLRHAEASYGHARLRQCIAQRPTETALDDAILDADHAIVIVSHRCQLLRHWDHPLRIRDGHAHTVSHQATRGLNRIGCACPGTDDENSSRRVRHGLVEKNIHSPDATKRGHGFWQRTLAVSDDGGCIVNIERLTHT